MIKMIHNLRNVVQNLEDLESEQSGKRVRYSDAAIAARSGVSRATIIKMMNNRTRRIDFDTVESLLDFFNAHGLEIGIADLFTVTTEDGPPDAPTP